MPARPGRVAAYFTAAKEISNLRFHLHAPFVPELSRSSIKNTPANQPLLQQLAGLAARSLFAIRDLGLLDRDFLAVLPNHEDEIPTQYICVRDAVTTAMNDQPLTPVHSGGHAPAKRLLQARAALKALLTSPDVDFLTGSDEEPRDWAIGATQRNSRVDRFLRGLDIEDWDLEQFAQVLEARLGKMGRFNRQTYSWSHGPDENFVEWLRSKPGEWHQMLYALLYRELHEEIQRFDELCMVRLSNYEYRVGEECYFPTPDIEEDQTHPRIDRNIYTAGTSKAEQENAKKFLEGVGVRKVGEYEQIEAILKHRYAEAANPPSWKTYVADLRRFISLVEDNRDANVLFRDYCVFERSNGQWSQPSGVYLDAPYLETGLNAYFEPLGTEAIRLPLSHNYQTLDGLSKFIKFAQICGAAVKLEIAQVSCGNNPNKEHLERAPGAFPTPTGTDRDFVIDGLDELFLNPTMALSRLVWRALCDRSQDASILQACFQYNQSNYPHYAESQLVHQLRGGAWIPQGKGELVRPAEASRDLLPQGFPFDPGWPWVQAIGFGEESAKRIEERRRNQEIAEKLGFSDDVALQHARQFAELSPVTRQKILEQHRTRRRLALQQTG